MIFLLHVRMLSSMDYDQLDMQVLNPGMIFHLVSTTVIIFLRDLKSRIFSTKY